MKMSTEQIGRLNQASAGDLTSGWSFREDEHFEALFLHNGPALVVASRLVCGRESWQLEFAADVLAPAWADDQDPSESCIISASEAFQSQSREGLVVEVAVVVGPFQDGRSVHEQTLGALSHMRQLLLEIDEALSTPDTIFRPEFAQWMDEELPSSEALLDHLVNLGQTMTSPTIQEFLTLLGASKRRRLH
jgi:hypothetical protein